MAAGEPGAAAAAAAAAAALSVSAGARADALRPVVVFSVAADSVPLVAAIATLFDAYRVALLAHGVPIDSFQGFAGEIASLPGPYAEPDGAMLIAVDVEGGGGAGAAVAVAGAATPLPAGVPPRWDGRGTPVGCIALKPLKAAGGVRTCEAKRLYVRPECRGRGAARALSLAVTEFARAAGYHRMVLDTLHRLEGALPLYASLGFTACEAYCFNPMPDVVFMELWLRPRSASAGSVAVGGRDHAGGGVCTDGAGGVGGAGSNDAAGMSHPAGSGADVRADDGIRAAARAGVEAGAGAGAGAAAVGRSASAEPEPAAAAVAAGGV